MRSIQEEQLDTCSKAAPHEFKVRDVRECKAGGKVSISIAVSVEKSRAVHAGLRTPSDLVVAFVRLRDGVHRCNSCTLV
jgi:hypothetical protein